MKSFTLFTLICLLACSDLVAADCTVDSFNVKEGQTITMQDQEQRRNLELGRKLTGRLLTVKTCTNGVMS